MRQSKSKYVSLPDRPEVLNPGDVWIDYATREIVIHLSDSQEMRFSQEEADKFFIRFQGARLCLHDHIRLQREYGKEPDYEADPFTTRRGK